jgi:hypothetical protein
MRYLLLSLITGTLLLASQQTEKQKIEDKELKNVMEQEKKFAKEQKFYMGDDYNLKGAEINSESLKYLQEFENLDDFDMDDVYD